MSSLRTLSTRRLLAACAAVVALGVAGAAIALAAGGGPVPSREPLAVAIRRALRAPQVAGVSARVTFRNHLIDAASVQGADPLLSGASGRLWIGSHGRLRLELQSDSGDVQVVSDGKTVFVSDPASNLAYRLALPPGHAHGHAAERSAVPSLAAIRRVLARLGARAHVGPATPSDIAGRPAYSVRVSPRRAGGLLAGAELAWDAVHGVPLRAAVYARGNDTPVLELTATHISFGSIPASTFAIPAPANATTVRLPAARRDHRSARRDRRHAALSAAATARKVRFPLSAPGSLAGRPRQSVRTIAWKGHPAALVTYGTGLGTIAVIERQGAAPVAPAAGRHGDGASLALPSVSINGSPGRELDTALGTVVEFERGGVGYLVAGSVSPADAKAAARGL